MSDIIWIHCCFICVTLLELPTALVSLHVTLTWDASGTLQGRISTKFKDYYLCI